MNIAQAEYWELTLAPYWDTWSDDECETIAHPEGVGALQISAARKDSHVTDYDLTDFARDHIDAGAKTKPVTLGDFSGITLCYDWDGSHWRQWYLRSGLVALFVTYNCNVSDSDKEDPQVDQMLGSLKVTGNAL